MPVPKQTGPWLTQRTNSVKSLFAKPYIASSVGVKEVISIRSCLRNHHDGLRIGLKKSLTKFLTSADGDGYKKGCRHLKLSVNGIPLPKVNKLLGVIPAWVAADKFETRTIEGIVTHCRVAYTDFPLRPWHKSYDLNIYIIPDKQYTYLVSNAALAKGYLEGEWETGAVPFWAWPQNGQRIILIGRWILDCGHPNVYGHRSEIHPPKALVYFDTFPIKFRQNEGITRANNAVVLIRPHGGYWRHRINDQNYEFDLYLPPKPYAEAKPVYKVQKQGTIPLAVKPIVTPYPKESPKLFRVKIPLKGVTPQPNYYGVKISAGWSDPHKTESKKIVKRRVTISKLFMDSNLDTWSRDEWYVWIGVNGNWRKFQNLHGSEKVLNISRVFDLHPKDKIRITVTGFEADMVNKYMGKRTGWTWNDIVNTTDVIGRIKSITKKLAGSFGDQNDPIGFLYQEHKGNANFTRKIAKSKPIKKYPGEFRLEYKIQPV